MRERAVRSIRPLNKIIISLLIIFSFFTCSPQTGDFLSLQRAYAAEKGQCVWTGIDEIIVVGDIHGDYNNFEEILKKVGLVDSDLHWKAGKTHFVQTGDILDRGKEAKKVLDLMISLEKEAEAAGGKVHLLLGNHEEMNIINTAFQQLGYVTVEQFRDFLPEKFRENREKKIRSKLEKNNSEGHSVDDVNAEIKKFWAKYKDEQKEAAGERYYMGFIDNYGEWLIEHNIVIKINNTIFIHAGLNEEFSTWPLEKINNQARRELRQYKDFARYQIRPTIIPPEIVNNGEGPFWFRGLALNDEDDFKEDVKRILKNLDAKNMVIAHTPKTNVIESRFDKSIWIVDTGISEIYQGRKTALVIKKGKFIPKGFQ
jgi:hypothetical protein